MRYASIREMDITNGIGIGVSLFVQGCTHHCKGCFNPETWDFNNGKEWTKEVEDNFIELCKRPHIDFISILGGEPFDQDKHILSNLLKKIKRETNNKDIYVWSGYTFDESDFLSENYEGIFNYVDYLIDGEFQLDKRDLNLKLRGSSNQRIIDVKESLKQDKIITIE
jgi:anaerobic ribonucleoside-triphosphate reductase activating protein